MVFSLFLLIIKFYFMETIIQPKNALAFSELTGETTEIVPYAEITPDESRVLRYAYRDGALARNSATIGKKDSTSVFLTRELLEQLIEIIDGVGSESPFLNPGVLAHWATFPSDYPDELLADRQTIVIEACDGSWIAVGYPCPPVCGAAGGACVPRPPGF